MIVEDEALIALSLEDTFRDTGYDIVGPFSSCADALAALALAAPDVAIVDATLSDGPCLELARELRRRGVPFIIYSGREAYDDHPPELEGVPWIEKPAAPEKVLRETGSLIGK